jgi:hypothetical protein
LGEWERRHGRSIEEWVEKRDRDLRERVTRVGMRLWVRVWGAKRGNCVLQALWIHSSGNDSISQLNPIRPLGSHAHRQRQQQGEGVTDAPTFGTVPTDIDIRSISSHAQAEALVQLAQQSIVDMDDHCARRVDDEDDLDGLEGVIEGHRR